MAARTRPLIGVVGDFSAGNVTHRFTNEALSHAGIGFVWVPTEAIGENPAGVLARFDGLWIAPASPYRSMDGALGAIRHARERGVPLVGT
jgi:CTP synthase (UTP-ammonia lyase)